MLTIVYSTLNMPKLLFNMEQLADFLTWYNSNIDKGVAEKIAQVYLDSKKVEEFSTKQD